MIKKYTKKHMFLLAFLLMIYLFSTSLYALEFSAIEPTVRKYFGNQVTLSSEQIHAGESKDVKWKVAAGGRSYFVRANTRENEKKRFLKVAKVGKLFGDLGLSPKVHLIDEDKGVLITDFVEGRILTQREIRDPAIQKRLIKVMHVIHHSKEALDLIDNSSDRADKFKALGDKMKKKGWYVPEQLDGAIDRLLKISLKGHYKNRVAICHRDLHRENILIDSSNKLWILDWETAKRSDPYSDVVATVFLSHFSDREELDFLKLYLKVGSNDKISEREWTRYLLVKAHLLAKKALNTVEGIHTDAAKGAGLTRQEMKILIDGGADLSQFPQAHPLQVRLIRTLRALRHVLDTPDILKVEQS